MITTYNLSNKKRHEKTSKWKWKSTSGQRRSNPRSNLEYITYTNNQKITKITKNHGGKTWTRWKKNRFSKGNPGFSGGLSGGA